MIDPAQKDQVLADILESPEFKEAKRYRELLQYLVEETLAGHSPKEITIGIQFFGKDASFDPKDDPIVRVYLNNLRKKLEHYYLTCKKPYSIKLSIPKGHYQVEFSEVTEEERKRQPVNIVQWISVALVAAATFFLGYEGRSLLSPPATVPGTSGPVWADFASAGARPTMIVLGDFFFLYERAESGKIGNFIRDVKINTPDDFRQAIKQNPALAQRFVQSDFTFLRPSASWGLAQVLPFVQRSPNGYSLKLASQFTVDDLKNNNVIFLGSFKTLFALHKFLHIFGLDYTITPVSFSVRDERTDSVRSFSPAEVKGGNYEKDFAVVAKGSGPEGSRILLLLGFADSGVLEAARAVTDPQMLEAIEAKLAGAPTRTQSFTLVVETEGMNQSIFKSQITHFSPRTDRVEPTPGNP